MLILYLVYRNTNTVEGNKGNKWNKMKRERRRKKRKPKPFISWDGDKYKSCKKCCGDDDGCYDSRCFGKCSRSSFRRGDGKIKRGPVRG